MTSGRKGAIAVLAAAVVAAGSSVLARGASGGGEEEPSVVARRGTIEAKALAVGTVEPETQITVKSQVSGVVQQAFVEEGAHVRAGEPLFELRPEPTPLELVEARRALEMREIAAASLERELERISELAERQVSTPQELDRARRASEEARLELATARDRLALLETGRVGTGDVSVQSVVRSPITGYVLERLVEIGDPVVPLSSFQEGTVLMTMADMDRLVFRGTVDEIDVGRLRPGMPASLSIGALPGVPVEGTLARISLKARSEESATVFPVEIELQATGEEILRAGFSANADILLEAREDVVVIPERVVTFEGDSAWVEVPAADGARVRQAIRTGLSDAVHVEVLDGLEESDVVLEKPLRTVGG